jgi:hypothetical protein
MARAPAKPKSDIYTGLLAISLIAMIVGCILLYADYAAYEGKNPPPPPTVGGP